MAPTSSKQHGVNVGVNASATPFQQASGYGSHGYSTGEALNHIEMACLERSCRSCSVHLHTNSSVLTLTMSPLISHWCGVHISFELCSICKHKHDACVKAFVSGWLLMDHITFLSVESPLSLLTSKLKQNVFKLTVSMINAQV